MNYITAREAAEAWGIGVRRVQYFCANDKIAGARRAGNQWLIPEDAPRPADGRTRLAKDRSEEQTYYYPFLVHTAAYPNRDRLPEDAAKLLEAQLLLLSGSYAETVSTCRYLLRRTKNRSLRMGAFCTIAYAAVPLGLLSLYREATDSAEALIASESLHREDFLLALEYVRYHITWDTAPIYRLECSRLSGQAQSHYLLVNALCASFGIFRSDPCFLRMGSMLSRFFEEQGLLPTAALMHFTIAIEYTRIKDFESSDKHLHAGLRLALEGGWEDLILSKYYGALTAPLDQLLSEQGLPTEHFRQLSQKIFFSWHEITENNCTGRLMSQMNLSVSELLHLLSFQLSPEEIAQIQGIPLQTVQERIRKQCEHFGFADTEGLVSYLRDQLSGSM